MPYTYTQASILGLAVTLAVNAYSPTEVTFKETPEQTPDGLTKFKPTGLPSKAQLAELFNLADTQACPENPKEEGCYSHVTASNIHEQGKRMYIHTNPLNEEINSERDELKYGYKTKSGITFKRIKPNVFMIQYENLTARDYSDLFDAYDITQGDKCENTGIKNYRTIEGIDYLVAKCKSKISSKENYTKINRKQLAVENLLAQKYLPGIYVTKKIKGKNKVIIDKRTKVTDFVDGVEQVCETLDMNCHALLNVMYFETGGTFDPQKRNPTGSATGLIQFVEDTASDLGTSTKKLKNMSALEQLTIVELYFKRTKETIEDHERICDYASPKTVALAVFYPGSIGRGKNYIIGQQQKYQTIKKKKGKKNITVNIPLNPIIPKYKQKNYSQNRGLDTNKDGTITANEYASPALSKGKF